MDRCIQGLKHFHHQRWMAIGLVCYHCTDLKAMTMFSPSHFHEMDRWAQNSPFGLKTEVTLQKQIEIHKAPFYVKYI